MSTSTPYPRSCRERRSSCSTPNNPAGATTTDRRSHHSGAGQGVEFRREGRRATGGHQGATRTILVCPDVYGSGYKRSAEARQAEFEGLAAAIGLDVVLSEIVRLREVKPATYIGGGHAEMLARRVADDDVELIVVDAALSPTQQRNLEEATAAKVLDRTALILEIFGERAASREGVLQVELAHLKYQRGRLVRSWTHLERQRGGGGFLGGPGETQIESDRRQLQERIALLEKRIEKVKQTRQLQRKTRDTVPYPVVALVGYTNAGKSSLFNRLTGAGVDAKDLLFATLDTTVRRIRLPHGRDVMLSDTVGFVSDLPTDLIAAFRATLEEVVEADVILHVRDIANEDHAAQASDVLQVLGELGINGELTPVIEVWNKIDRLERDGDGKVAMLSNIAPAGRVAAKAAVSAITGEGIPDLLEAIEKALAHGARTFRVDVPHERGEDLAWLYGHAEILERGTAGEKGTEYLVRVQPRFNAAFQSRFRDRVLASDPA